MNGTWVTVALVCIGLAGSVMLLAQTDGPQYGGRYTEERIANLRANVEEYDWAAAQRDAAIDAAKKWVQRSDDQLWRMIPSQRLPRCIDTTMTNAVGDVAERKIHVCPVCGEKLMKHGNYPYSPSIEGLPWKLTCPSCKVVMPTNDFGKYYESGIDETGCFNPDVADRSLLFNEEHPDPDDPLHTWGVDDGFGWTDENGIEYRFIGYYVWKYWSYVQGAIGALANAYLYTGEPIYAHKCAVMLDRFADVYPDMDWAPYAQMGWYHSDGGSRLGKIQGKIWETGTVSSIADYYDRIRSGLHDQPELYAFLAEKGREYTLPTEKGSLELLNENIETNAIGCGVEAIFSGQVRSNEGGYQLAVLRCAMAVNRDPLSTEWCDWIFSEGRGTGATEGGHIPGLIIGEIDRDGVGAEGAPGYSLGWASAIGGLADTLAEYEGYTKHDIYRDFPMFKKTIRAGWDLGILGVNTPNIGDAGSCGSRGLVMASPHFLVRGYKYLKDPELALLAVHANGGKYEGLGRDIYAEDPDWVANDIEALLEERGMQARVDGENLSGYGLVSAEFGPVNTGHGLWMYYGRNGGHGHRDRLNFGLDAYGFCVTPDLGYPEFATRYPKRNQWTDPTISHNTMLIDESPQSTNWVGHPEFFAQMEGFGGFCVGSPEVYPDTAQIYNRTMALMQVDDGTAYAVDVFRCEGGSDHLMSFHGLPGEVTVEGLGLVAQEGGSYAGADVEWMDSPWDGPRTGYAWLNNVERDQAPVDSFVLDYAGEAGYRGLKAEDDLHLRYHCLTQYDDVALADGYPPANKSGAPEKLRYMLGHRSGAEGLQTTAVAVIEPFKQTPLIVNATRLAVSGSDEGIEAVAVRVELANGAVDYILSAPDDDGVYETEDGISFSGRLAALRMRDGSVEQAWLVRASSLTVGEFSLETPAAGYTGTIGRMDRDLSGHGSVWVETELPTDDTLAGSEIIIENDRVRNAVYTIESVEKDGELYRIDCGEVAFTRSFLDPMDYSKGYKYNFEEGAGFIIPNRIHVRGGNAGRTVVHAHPCDVRPGGWWRRLCQASAAVT